MNPYAWHLWCTTHSMPTNYKTCDNWWRDNPKYYPPDGKCHLKLFTEIVAATAKNYWMSGEDAIAFGEALLSALQEGNS